MARPFLDVLRDLRGSLRLRVYHSSPALPRRAFDGRSHCATADFNAEAQRTAEIAEEGLQLTDRKRLPENSSGRAKILHIRFADPKALEFDPRLSAAIIPFPRSPAAKLIWRPDWMRKACTARGSGRFLKSTPIGQFVEFLLRAECMNNKAARLLEAFDALSPAEAGRSLFAFFDQEGIPPR